MSKRVISLPEESNRHRFSQAYVVGMSGPPRGGANKIFGFTIEPNQLLISENLAAYWLKSKALKKPNSAPRSIDITLSGDRVLVKNSPETPHVAVSYSIDGVFSLLSPLEGGETAFGMEWERIIIVGPLKMLEVLNEFHPKLTYPGESEEALKGFVDTLYDLLSAVYHKQHVVIAARVTAV